MSFFVFQRQFPVVELDNEQVEVDSSVNKETGHWGFSI